MSAFIRYQTLRIAPKVLNPNTFTPASLSSPECYQCVRWSRKKPRWLPMAKTKMFRIHPRVNYPAEENALFRKLHQNYKTFIKAIHHYYAERTRSQSTGEEVIAEQARLEKEQDAVCVKINEEWNKKVAIAREERMAKELEVKIQEAVKEIEQIKLQEEEAVRNIDALVKQEKEKSATFITAENIDEAIEKALSKAIDFNYCIDLDGNLYKGLRARPGVTEPTMKLAQVPAS